MVSLGLKKASRCMDHSHTGEGGAEEANPIASAHKNNHFWFKILNLKSPFPPLALLALERRLLLRGA